MPPLCPSRWLYPMCQSCSERDMQLALKLSHFSLGILFHPAQANCDGWDMLIKSKPKIKASLTSELHRRKRTLRSSCSCSAYWTVFISDIFHLLSAFFKLLLVYCPAFICNLCYFGHAKGSPGTKMQSKGSETLITLFFCVCVDTKLGKVFKPSRSRWLGSANMNHSAP